MDWFNNISPVWQALIATTFTWGITALGALTVCFFKDLNKKVLNTILGFSAGVMIAASFWSLKPKIVFKTFLFKSLKTYLKIKQINHQ